MKNIMSLVIMLFVVVLSVNDTSAQGIVAKGLKAGINLANVSGDDIEEEDTKMRLGYAAGGFVTLGVSEQFALQPEIYYASKGFKIEDKHYDSETDYISSKGTISLNYLEIPVLGVFSVNKNLNLLAGPYIEIYLNGKMESDIEFHGDYDPEIWGESGQHTEDIESDEINSPGYGFVIGAEILTGQFSIGARYSMGLSTIPDEEDDDTKHKVIQIIAGFHLP